MNISISRSLLTLLTLSTLILFAACSKNSTGDDDVEEEDGIAPSPISSLAIVSFTDSSVTLSWVSPGDDSTSGTADRYDLRCSTEMITFENFIDADRIMYCPKPMLSGTLQTVEVVGLSMNVRYYFSIIAFDENNNYSYPSNVVDAMPFSDAEITFPDASFEAVVRATINQPAGPLLRSSLITIKEIHGDDAGISDLTGLEYCINVEVLLLMNDNISDLTPLAGLSRLWGVQAYGNQITDLTPLSGITNLVQLNLGANPITSVAPLKNLPNLNLLRLQENSIPDIAQIASITSIEDLDLHSCQLSNISFLAGLTNLKYLQLQVNSISNISALSSLTQLRQLVAGVNSITDLSPLTALPNIESLYLDGNQISDLAPLVNNTGIGSGDVIRVDRNPLSQTAIDTQIPALQTRGVTVYH